MSATAIAHRPNSGSLYDVVDVILDKGLVIDAFVRVSLVGIELLTVDARIVVASVDTYLHFAEAVDRLDLTGNTEPRTLPDLFGDSSEEVSRGKAKGAIEGGIDKIKETFSSGEGDGEKQEQEQGSS